jgi:Tol biopolymer transport system component/uncharacterized protein (UPF0333 family)
MPYAKPFPATKWIVVPEFCHFSTESERPTTAILWSSTDLTHALELFDMRQKPKKSVTILLASVILLALVMFYVAFKKSNSTELLVAWGWQGDRIERKCTLQVINPKSQERGRVHTKDENCNYQVINIQGHPYLVGVQDNPRSIVLYSITASGDLVIEKTIPIEGATVVLGSLHPQFEDGDDIYFSGILNSATGEMKDRIQLLRLNSQTEEITSFVAYEEGMIDFPLLSPDGSHLIYSAFPGLKTWADCRSHCGSYYHLVDLETNSGVNLALAVNYLGANSTFSHCNLHWAPNGRFIAFNLGCESESPGYIVIFNVEENEVVTVIKAIESTSNADIVGWLSNDAIIYGQNVSKEGYQFHFYRYFTYSLSENASSELTDLPLINSEGLGLVIRGVNLTVDGKYLAAAINGWSETVAPLLVMGIGSEESSVSYISTDTINERPLWSPSGDWIAYISFEDPDAWYESRNIVKITDRAGDTVIDTDIVNITSLNELRYFWLQP